MSQSPSFITVTELDHVRLSHLISAMPSPSPAVESLERALDQADQVSSPDIPGNVVTMRSRMRVRTPDGQERSLTLCYPPDADAVHGHVSVLSPMGASLLGMHVPGTASWTPPDGVTRSVEVVTVEFQPEASGDYTS